jgi:hypothetical protein
VALGQAKAAVMDGTAALTTLATGSEATAAKAGAVLAGYGDAAAAALARVRGAVDQTLAAWRGPEPVAPLVDRLAALGADANVAAALHEVEQAGLSATKSIAALRAERVLASGAATLEEQAEAHIVRMPPGKAAFRSGSDAR